MDDQALRALGAAWTVTVIAVVIFAAVLSLSPFWKGPAYFRALQDALAQDGWDQFAGD